MTRSTALVPTSPDWPAGPTRARIGLHPKATRRLGGTTDHLGDPTLFQGQPANAAIPALLKSHGGQIYGLGLRLCDDPDKAQDLVQETFMRALKSWDTFDGRSKPSTWLYVIATRACQRLERRRAGEPRSMKPLEQLLPSGDTTIVDLPSSGDTPLEWAERQEVIEAVRGAIDTLPLRFRLPLVLKEIEEMSIKDVAAILGLKEATVKTRLHRARLLVRSTMAEHLPQRAVQAQNSQKGQCLDLLWAKQEALDRGIPFSIPVEHLCDRCRSVFATLDLGSHVCRALGSGELPESVRSAIEDRLAGEAS